MELHASSSGMPSKFMAELRLLGLYLRMQGGAVQARYDADR